MKIEVDKKLLIFQCQKEKPGSMIGVDEKLKLNEEIARKRTAVEAGKKLKTYEEIEKHFDACQFATLVTDDSIYCRQSSGGGATVKNFSRTDQQIPATATATAIEIASAVQATPAIFQIFILCLAEVFIGKK